MKFYDRVRSVPENAKRPIVAGRLKGKTDINPMWRIKILTEEFGMCGVGWKYEITEQKTIEGGNGELAAFVTINLYVKNDGKWSDAIQGVGGSMFVSKEKNGLYTNDECFKMALTDAISVSCKALGIGADVYWEKDRSKYNRDETKQDFVCKAPSDKITDNQIKRLIAISKGNTDVAIQIMEKYKYKATKEILKKDYNAICEEIENIIKSKNAK